MSKKKIVVILFIVAILVAGSYFLFFKKEKNNYEFAVAKKANLVQEVSVTGRVKPSTDVSLAFEKTGKITFTSLDIGDRVFAGDTLARIDSSDTEAQLDQAEASEKIQRAVLAELLKGTREEEISVQESKVNQAKFSLSDAKKNLLDKIQESYTKSDDAVRNNIDQFFNNPRGSEPKINLSIGDTSIKSDIDWQRLVVEKTLTDWKTLLSNSNLLNNISDVTSTSKNNLNEVKDFLDKVALVVNELEPNSGITQTTIDGYKTDVSTSRTNINTIISSITTAEEKLKTAETNLTISENELTLKKAGTIEEQIKAQEAKVEEAEASVKNYQAQLRKTVLFSPINGTVVQQDAKVGEIAPAGTTIISLISDSNLKTEANVPEADIAKIKTGDKAQITLDAYEDTDIFEATVTSIDPSGVIIDGVATYKITLHFVKKDSRIKPEMTTDITILTDTREDVISLPQRSIVQKNGGKIVRIIVGDSFREVEVTTGLKGSYGEVEILSGVNIGDKIITNYNME